MDGQLIIRASKPFQQHACAAPRCSLLRPRRVHSCARRPCSWPTLLPRVRRSLPSGLRYVTSIQPFASSPSMRKGTGYGTLNGSALNVNAALQGEVWCRVAGISDGSSTRQTSATEPRAWAASTRPDLPKYPTFTHRSLCPSPVKLEVDPQPAARRRLAAAAPHDAEGQALATAGREPSQRPAVSAGLRLHSQVSHTTGEERRQQGGEQWAWAGGGTAAGMLGNAAKRRRAGRVARQSNVVNYQCRHCSAAAQPLHATVRWSEKAAPPPAGKQPSPLAKVDNLAHARLLHSEVNVLVDCGSGMCITHRSLVRA